ncbi:MAG TPA: YCF48-related protein [Bacteroidales bacterium]|nr:YCF48-related protein [Bacteroidales bacterium]
MVKKNLFFLILVILLGCEQQDPEIILQKDYRFNEMGWGQRAVAGEELADSVGLYISGLEPGKNLRIEFEVIRGGGSVDPGVAITNDNNQALTHWVTGLESTRQTVRAKIFDNKGNLLSSRDLNNLAFREDRLDSLYYPPEPDLNDMAWNPLTHETYLVNGFDLFTQGERYFDWNPSHRQELKGAREIEFDSQGNLYVGNNKGEILKSTDGGSSWQFTSTPIPGFEGVLDFTITQNDYLWITSYNHSLRCSRDGGKTWSVDTTGLAKNERIGDIYSLSDGTLLLLTLNSNVYQSTDDGHTWQSFEAPGPAYKLFVTPDDEIIVFTLTLTTGSKGYTVYKADSPGEEFNKTDHIPSQFGARNLIHAYLYEGLYYVGIPGAGIFTTSDFEEFEEFVAIPRLFELFITGEGTLIGTDIRKIEAYYKRILSSR